MKVPAESSGLAIKKKKYKNKKANPFFFSLMEILKEVRKCVQEFKSKNDKLWFNRFNSLCARLLG